MKKQLLGACINKGIIYIIPKLGDLELITYWRLISHLNVSSKIWARVLAMRIKHILPIDWNR